MHKSYCYLFYKAFPLLFFGLCLSITTAIQAQDNSIDISNLARKYYDQKDFKKALVYYEQLKDLRPDNGNYYNAACVAALAGDKEKGFLYLKRAISIGYSDTSYMNSDTDLNGLHKDTRWKQRITWVEEARAKAISELKKITSGCPATYLIPYKSKGLWGYMHATTKEKITEAIFAEVSFVGESAMVAFGTNGIYFTCQGNIERIAEFDKMAAYYSYSIDYDSQIPRGFEIRSDNYTVIASSIYSHISPFKVYKDSSMAIVKPESKRTYSLIDRTGNILSDTNRTYVDMDFHNFGKDSDSKIQGDKDNHFYVFYKTTNGKAGLLGKEEVVQFDDYDFSWDVGRYWEFDEERHRYVYLKQRGKWGIWDCEQKVFLIAPQYDEIIATDRSYTGHYEGSNDRKTVALYFLVRKKGQVFYIDKANNQYIVK